jgi:hypothetical protein
MLHSLGDKEEQREKAQFIEEVNFLCSDCFSVLVNALF